MASHKAVIVSNADPMERIVTEENCGVVFEAGNPYELANAVQKLIKDRGMSLQMGLRGREADEGKYNWENDLIVLRNIVEELQLVE